MTEPDRTDWPLVLLLWGAGLGAAAQYGKVSVVFDRLPAIWPEAGAAVGFAVSLVGAVGILLGVAAGVLVAHLGYRRAILTALVAGAAISVFEALTPPLWLFLLARCVEGAAHLALVVAIPTMIAEVTAPRDRGLALTLWGTFFGVAFAVLAWCGLPLVPWIGVPGLWLLHAVYMAVMAAFLAPLLPRIRTAPPEPVRISELVLAHGRIYSSPFLSAPAAGWLCYTLSYVSLLTVLPPALPEGTRALTMGLLPLLSILSSMTLGVWLLRVMSAVSVSIAGFAASCAVALAMAAFGISPALALLLGGTLGLVQGSGFAAVPQLNGAVADRALANGGLAQMGNLGNTLGTPILVAVIAVGGYEGVTWLLATIFAAGAGVHLALAAVRKGTPA
ncbi:MFS transporter [Rhodobacterales bacterium HKCCE2091]|nr:MFS transporter [Rhodobacterales bacterium HKCCE2091]